MNALQYQPVIEPQRTFGESPFRLEVGGSIPQLYDQLTAPAQLPFGPGASFAPAATDDLWANRRPVVLSSRRRRLPVVPATGRIITQQEIDDALDD